MKAKSCCDEDRRPPHPMGTVGLAYEKYQAIVIADLGTFCGGGDDIKAVVNYEGNEWDVGWLGADEFAPIAESAREGGVSSPLVSAEKDVTK